MSHVQDDVDRDADPPHYPQLDHPTRDGRQQYDLLLAACAPGGALAGYVPVHLFYNELPASFQTPSGWVCDSVFPGDRTEFGVTYARTEDVKVIADARLALAIRGAGRARFPYDLFREVSRPWLCLLCTTGAGCHGGAITSPWPPQLSRDEPPDSGGFPPRTTFTPAAWPDAPVDPTPWTPDSDDRLTATLLSALTEGDAWTLKEARDAARPYARAVLVVET